MQQHCRLREPKIPVAKLRVPAITLFVSFIFTITAAPICFADKSDGLEVRILLPRSAGVVEVDFTRRQTLELKNTTNQDLKIWRPNAKAGWDSFSLHFTNSRTGATNLVRKRSPIPDRYWDVDEPETVTIPGGQSYRWDVDLNQTVYSEFLWTRPPLPNSSDNYFVRAQFELPKSSTGIKDQLWNGKTLSQPIEIRLIMKPDTPQRYIAAGFPEKAIELLQADQQLIKKIDATTATPLQIAARVESGPLVQWLSEHGANPDSSLNDEKLYFDSPDMIRKFIHFWPQIATHNRRMGSQLLEAAKRSVSATEPAERKKWREVVDACRAAGAEYDLLTAITLDDIVSVKEILSNQPELADQFPISQRWYMFEQTSKPAKASTFNFDPRVQFQQEPKPTTSPLRVAAGLGRLEICKYLIDQHHSDVNDLPRGWGVPIIKDALKHPRIVKLLIDRHADISVRFVRNAITSSNVPSETIGNNATLLHFAARDGDPETVQILIDAGLNLMETADARTGHGMPNGEEADETALDVAAIYGHAENARGILDHERFQKLDQPNRTKLLNRCLILANRSYGLRSDLTRQPDRVRLVAALLERGADPNAQIEGHTPAEYASQRIEYSRTGIQLQIVSNLKALQAHGARIDIYSAVAMNDEQLVTRLIKENPQSAKACSIMGVPALHLAVVLNNSNIVKKLLQAGCNADITDKHPTTALSIAAYRNNLEIANILLAASADAAFKGRSGLTPLHSALQEGNLEMIQLLLDHGADKLVSTPDDEQALMKWLKMFQMSDGLFDEIRTIVEQHRRNRIK